MKNFLEKRIESNKTQFCIPCKGKTIVRFINNRGVLYEVSYSSEAYTVFMIQLERVADKYSHVRINLWGKNTDHILYSYLKKTKRN